MFGENAILGHNEVSIDEKHRIIIPTSTGREQGEKLILIYDKDIELYFLRTKMSGFPVFEKENCFEQIWLRATPDDFNNPEAFLKKQVVMINDTTFAKYDNETSLGKIAGKLQESEDALRTTIDAKYEELINPSFCSFHIAC